MLKRLPTPFVWILDEDLSRSAKFLPNKMLELNIRHLMSCLFLARCYFLGIRTQAIFKWKFSKDNIEDTLSDMFPLENPISMKSMGKFSFSSYSNRTAKWCRKCKEHYMVFKNYLRECLAEEEFRFGKIRKSHAFGEILVDSNDGFEDKIPLGNLSKVVYEWKSIPVKFRCKDILEGYRKLFLSKVEDPFEEYAMTKRDIPDFVMKRFKLDLQ